ncbi:MAG: hypothetical protein ACHQKY_07360 [Terriglobia bacterium]
MKFAMIGLRLAVDITTSFWVRRRGGCVIMDDPPLSIQMTRQIRESLQDEREDPMGIVARAFQPPFTQHPGHERSSTAVRRGREEVDFQITE